MVFCVIYRWKVSKKDEKEFIRNWKEGTQETYRLRGSLGSSLHKLSDGTYLAYARWPNKKLWQKMMLETKDKNRNPLGILIGRPIEMELKSDLINDKPYNR